MRADSVLVDPLFCLAIMESNKDFDAYAASLFGEDYHEKKKKKGTVAPWSEQQEYHPKPFDVVVVDKNENVIKGKKKDKPHKTGIGKRISEKKKSTNNDGRLTPVIIDMNDSPIEENTQDVINKRRKERPKDARDSTNKDKKTKLKLEQLRFEGDDSGISLTEDGEDVANVFREQGVNRHDDSGSESDLAYFCVDHMKLCNSKAEYRKHRHCNLNTKSGTSSPITSRTSHERVKSRATRARSTEERSLSSASLFSRTSSTGNIKDTRFFTDAVFTINDFFPFYLFTLFQKPYP